MMELKWKVQCLAHRTSIIVSFLLFPFLNYFLAFIFFHRFPHLSRLTQDSFWIGFPSLTLGFWTPMGLFGSLPLVYCLPATNKDVECGVITERQPLSWRVADSVKKKKKVSLHGLEADFLGANSQQCLGGLMAFCVNCFHVYQKIVLASQSRMGARGRMEASLREIQSGKCI